MYRVTNGQIGLTASLALLAGLLAIAAPAWSADEDTSSSVYLVFDPETGEFKTEHDPNMNQAAQATQEAIDSVADVSGDATVDGAGADTATAGTNWIVLAVVIGLASIGGLFLLRGRRSSS